jgi:ankyrin repeat protein
MNDYTPLALSLWNLNFEEATNLINNGADLNEAVRQGDFRTPICLLMQKKIEGDDHEIVVKAVDDCFKITKLMLEKGANPNTVVPGQTPSIIRAIIAKKPLDLIELIAGYSNLMDPFNDAGLSVPFITITESDDRMNKKIFKIFYKYSNQFIHNCLPDNTTLIHCSAALGHLKTLQFLCEKKGDELKINAPTAIGMTALHYATLKNRLNCVKFLIDNKADSTLKTIYGAPLHIASRYGYWEIVENLIKKDVDVHALDLQGDGAYRITCFSYHVQKIVNQVAILQHAGENNEEIIKLRKELTDLGSNEDAQGKINELINSENIEEMNKKIKEKTNNFERCGFLLKNKMYEKELSDYKNKLSGNLSENRAWKKIFCDSLIVPESFY